MSEEDAGDTPEGIEGRRLERAVDAAVARDDTLDRDTARAALGHVTTDGVVSREAVDEALSEASMYVSTAETRTELASIELGEAREVAAPVADVDAVAARLDEFESRLHEVEARAADLGDDLERLVDRRDDADLLEVATRIHRVRADAAGVQGSADELQVDVDEFKHWVVDPDVRYRSVEADLDAVEEWLDELTDATDLLASDADGTGSVDRGVVWFDAELHRRLLDLLLADVRAELADLRTLTDRELDVEIEGEIDVDHEDRLAALATRLAEHEDRLAAAGDRLDDLARPDWRERFDERLAAFDAALADFEPPVDWGALGETFAEHRPTEAGA